MGSPGVFECVVVKAMRSESSQKHTHCFAVQAEVFFLDKSDTLWGNIYLTDSTIGTPSKPGMAIHQLKALGYAGPLGELYKNPMLLAGAKSKCVVEESANGSLRIAKFGGDVGMEVVASELARLEAFDRKRKDEPSVENFDKKFAAEAEETFDSKDFPEGFFGDDGKPKF